MNVRRGATLLAAAVLSITAAALIAAPAQAAPTLTVSPQAGAPGEQLTASGGGFQLGTVGLHLDTVVVGAELATVDVDEDGTFVVTFGIPPVPDGPHQVIACLDVSSTGVCREQAIAPIRVVTTPPTTSTEPLGVVVATTTSTTSPGFVAETTAPPIPTIPPVIVSSSTSGPLDEGQPPGEIIPDIEVRAVEITQGIQDLASRMPLVAGRSTVVRVHIDTSGGYVGTVDGALLVERAGEEDLILHPDNGPIPPGLDRTEIDGALNFDLPWQVFTEGETTFTAQVWSAGGAWITEEPDSDNNLMSRTVEFHTGENPTIWVVALDDGAGPGPVIDDVDDVLFPFAVFAYEDLVDYLPLATVNFLIYPEPVLPGPEAAEPGLWNLGLDSDVDPTAGARRHEPNIRMAAIAEVSGLLDDATMVGLVDDTIPTGGFSGWASNGVSWTQAEGGTAAHEVAHVLGLDHVNCVGDTDGDGVSQEDEAGAIDWSHPNGLPPVCSLSEVDPDGFFGYTTYHDPATIYSNDPGHPQAAFPLMSYADPKWSDPYHYCQLLDATGVPCNPALLGLPPADPFQVIDCEPEELPGELQLDLCISQEPAADVNDAVPAPGELVAEVTTNSVGMETLEIVHEGFTFDVPVDPESWIVASGSVDVDSGTGALAQAVMQDELRSHTASRFRPVARRARDRQIPTRVGAPTHRRRRLAAGRRPGRRRRRRPRQRRRIRPRQDVRILLAGAVGRRSCIARPARQRGDRRQPADQPDRAIGRCRPSRNDRVGADPHRPLGSRRPRSRRAGRDDVHGAMERRRRDVDPRRRRRDGHRGHDRGVGGTPRRRRRPGPGHRQRRCAYRRGDQRRVCRRRPAAACRRHAEVARIGRPTGATRSRSATSSSCKQSSATRRRAVGTRGRSR